ncbi:hypothetical protein SASPL_141673 [Salvia splendens]|uniref:NAC domain-containing protein n=1 Tax=Salvia splendens TaxID=180675 RepID=A0A8X8WJJ7_SALSN|nr:hypothetical protein SASPL_141673 [Salvia splendens]
MPYSPDMSSYSAAPYDLQSLVNRDTVGSLQQPHHCRKQLAGPFTKDAAHIEHPFLQSPNWSLSWMTLTATWGNCTPSLDLHQPHPTDNYRAHIWVPFWSCSYIYYEVHFVKTVELDIIVKLLDEKIKRLPPFAIWLSTDAPPFVDVLLQLSRNERCGFVLGDISIKALILDMFVAGSDKTSTTNHQQHEALPPGFRFHPTDEDCTFSSCAIAEADLNKSEPWQLPAKAKMGMKEKEWYFFTLRGVSGRILESCRRAEQARKGRVSSPSSASLLELEHVPCFSNHNSLLAASGNFAIILCFVRSNARPRTSCISVVLHAATHRRSNGWLWKCGAG